MTKTLELGLVAVVTALIVIAALLIQKPQTVGAVGMLETNIGDVATSSTATAVTTSVRIAATTTVATNPDGSYLRVWTSICTNSATPVALNLDGDKATDATAGAITTWIAAAAGYNNCFEINDRNQYNGSITASSTTGMATPVTVKQYVRKY